MNKTCCVGDTNASPGSSSCSMILRSACSHKHRRVLVDNKHKSSGRSRQQRKYIPDLNAKEIDSGSCEETSQLGSFLETSFKELALQSAKKTYSILKGSLYNSLELSENRNFKVYEANLLDSTYGKDLHFSQISVSSNSYLNDGSFSKEECSDYSSGVESDLNKDSSNTFATRMSRTQRYNRSSVSSMRALSGSDTEEDTSNIQSRLLARRKAQSSTGSKLSYSAGRNTLSAVGVNSHITSSENNSRNNIYSSLNNHSSRFSHGDSEVDSVSSDSLHHISTVQNSTFDRYRWFLWSYTYLKIITNVNFDVWFLSRLHKYGKYKAISFSLLPLLFFLLWGLIQSDSHSSFSAIFDTLNSGFSSFIMYLSTMFSTLGGYFVQKEEVMINVESEEEYCSSITSGMSTIFSTLSGAAGFFSDLFFRSKDSSSSSLVSHTTSESSAYQPNKEEIKMLIMEILNKEVDDLQRILKVSNAQNTQADKSEKDKQLQNEIKNLRLQFQALSGNLKEFEKDIVQQIEKSSSEETISILTAKHNNHIDLLNAKLRDIEDKLAILEALKKCCGQTWTSSDFVTSLETHLTAALKNIIDGNSKEGSPYHFFNTWLTSKFVDHKKLSEEIDAAVEKFKTSERKSEVIKHDTVKIVENVVRNYAESLKTNLSQMNNVLYFGSETASEEFVKKVVKEAIMLYDADKTGLVDYALESGGGSVLGTRCSETYVEKNGKFRIFGLPVWSSSKSPRTAIQPGIQPGECWAFQGSQGFLVLELSAIIYPTGFTMEHIPVSISPSGSIDSAPKDFSVWGLKSETDNKGILLGTYTYDANGEALQYFAAQNVPDEPFSIVELKIHSNHGNLEYTCLYRFRVHGNRTR